MELNDNEKKVLLIAFYLCKLVEFNILENSPYKITGKGFDMAYDVYKSGLKVDESEIVGILASLGVDDVMTLFQLTEIIVRIQDMGLDEFKADLDEFLKNNPEE